LRERCGNPSFSGKVIGPLTDHAIGNRIAITSLIEREILFTYFGF
jgi:hypothetical protein